MSDYGDGSDGELHVTSGTFNLSLNHKHQFTKVTVDQGAILSSDSSTGSVLYILASESIEVNGSINLKGIVNNGSFASNVTIDNTIFRSPGVAQGGQGGGSSNSGYQSSGFGGGGKGGEAVGFSSGNEGGNGSASAGSGGSGGYVYISGTSATGVTGARGGPSSGGGGSAYAEKNSSTDVSPSAQGGKGGDAYGNNGSIGTGSGLGTYNRVAGAGGGGGGGIAGQAGIHLVLISPKVTITGTINVSGSDGGNGGNGGNGYQAHGSSQSQGSVTATRGYGGGGGGGGHSGNIYITSSNYVSTGIFIQTGGTGGSGGSGNISGAGGSNGASGIISINPQFQPDDSILLFSTKWDIDQLVATNNVSVPTSGIYKILDFSALDLPIFPVTEVQFQPLGSSQWFTPGLSSTDGTLNNTFTFYFYIQNNSIYVNAGSPGIARYFLWSDKVDY